MSNQIKLIAYWLYLWAAFSLVGIYWSSGALELAIAVLLTGLFYHAGTGILKVRDRDRKIAIGLLVFLTLTDLDIVIRGLSGAESTYEIVVTLLSIVTLILSGTSTYYLLSSNVIKHFKQGNNA